MSKKIKTIMLTVFFTFTLIFAGKVLVDAIANNDEGKITVNKTATKDIGVDGNEEFGRKANVTLSVSGNEFTTASSLDVVLVIDRSGSMNDKANEDDEQTKMQATKSSATLLVEELLGNNTNDRSVVRMGISTFGTDIFSSLTSSSLTSDSTTITNLIDSIPDTVYNQGTNIQSGLEKAKELLSDSDAKNKVVILLTDGEPTFFNYDGKRYGNGSSDSSVCVEENNYGWCTKELRPSDAAKTEAAEIKDDGSTIYTIGFGLGDDDDDTTTFLEDVATNSDNAFLANDEDELLENFNDIIKSITTIANNLVVTDTVPAGFIVDEDALKTAYGDKVTIEPGEKGTTVITWDIGELTVTEDPTLTYQVTAKDDYYGGMYTNVVATLTGDAAEGNPSYPNGEIEEVFQLPEIAIPMHTESDSYTAKLGEALTIATKKEGILDNDSKNLLTDGDETTVVDEIIIKNPSCGSLDDIEVNEDGTFTYKPNSSCYGKNDNKVTFDYEVKSTITIDGEEFVVTSNTSTITIDLTKDDSELEEPTLTKVNKDGSTTTSITEPFNYTINYKTTILNHVGTSTITIVDKLPYEIDLDKSNIAEGEYDAVNKTITWTETISDINSYKNENNEIDITKNISVVYKNVPTDVESIVNEASVTTDIDNNPVETEQETEVIRGNLVVEYEDNLGNELLDDITSVGLIGTEYETSADNTITKDDIEYKLVAVKVNGEKQETTNKYSGEYVEGTTTVTYIYYKVTGDIDNTVLTKEGSDKVISSDGEFDYTISYKTTIDNYIGEVEVVIVDELPYELDLTKVDVEKDLAGGIYDADAKTITWVEKEDINTYKNGAYSVNIKKDIKLVFSDIDATKRELVNKVTANIKTSKSEEEKTDEKETKLEIKGTVIAHYVDINNEKLVDDVKLSDLVGNDYTTTAKNIDGYELVDVEGEVTGKYIDGTIEVTYIYYRETGEIVGDSIVKKGTEKVDSIDDVFSYEITYGATIKDYIGDAKVTIVDTLPLEIDLEKSDLNGGIYDKDTKTITWVEDILDIDTNKDGKAYSFEITKNISVVYIGLEPTVRELTNSVNGKVETDVTESQVEDDMTTTVAVEGNVIVHYVDTLGNTIESDVKLSDLVGNDYTTSAKTITGYELVRVEGEKVGKYIDGTIEVTYVYYKVEGNIADNTVIKTGTEEVDSVNDTFNYNITYKTSIDSYIGEAKVTIVDTLPLEIDLEKSDLNGGIYDKDTKTITWVEDVLDIDTNRDGEAKVIEITKNISVVYVGLEPTVRELTNSVVGTIKTDLNEVTTEPSDKTTVVKVEGKVIAHYVDINGEVVASDVILSDLVGNDYTTTAKNIDNYELVEVKGNTTGKYIDGTIEVTYVYYRETGEIVGDSIVKKGTEKVDSIDDVFNYEITYGATIKDYIGDAKVTIVDTLPLEIDLEKSDLNGGIYDKDTKTITWVEDILDIDTNKDGKAYSFEITKNISVVYVGLEPTVRELTNSVSGKVSTEVTDKSVEDDMTTTVAVEGEVIAHYVNTLGNTILEDVKTNGLVGNEYTTLEKEIEGYELVDITGEVSGKYIDGTIEVTYIYYKETGEIVDEVVEKTGDEKLTIKGDKVSYNIDYKSEIKEYIGNAEVIIIDYLPLAIDVTESNLDGGIYDEENLTITWIININDINTYVSGENYKIEISKNLLLSYKEMDLSVNKIVNKVNVEVKTDISEGSSEDKFDTIIDVKGSVIVNYVDDKGNVLLNPILLTGKVGSTYITEEKAFMDYVLIDVLGDKNGQYIDGTLEITYVYTELGKGGDVEEMPPQTGVENKITLFSILNSLILMLILLFRK